MAASHGETLSPCMQGQLSLLLHATAAPPEVYSFELPADRRLPHVDGLAGGRSPFGTPNQAWLCRELLEVLCYLTEAGGFAAVRQILELPAKTCPEVSQYLAGQPACRGGAKGDTRYENAV